ncbi:nf-kappa-b essential modulator [Holotrichia oblita]|uniref:Nf-kappa-b essential modulator n=2 Tax=Holotrichia oblita TaxID=644536 RepID=A0ACB9TNP1_HOLOL|nr:nf-kappa-b essential modulator [Holotrichia oblita]KAI4468425.1 nf-kappa-b essential modulator [Holotrichia oblita]
MATAFNPNSGIHQLPSNCYPPSESDDEDSFVVLNNSLGPDVYTDRVFLNTEPISTDTIQASLDSIADSLTRQTLQASQSSEMENSAVVVDSTLTSYHSTEVSPDEIQKKVDNLITENLKLKETLAQNNIAMKKQVETITQWQAEVQRVQESHKEKFSDMKKYITILKTENEKLRENLKIKENSAEENDKKAKEILTKQSDNIKQFELEAAQKKIKELEKALDIISLEKEDITKKMSTKEIELNNIFEDKKLLIYELELVRQKEKEQISASEIQELKDEIVELRDSNNNLADQISVVQMLSEKLKAELIEKEESLSNIHSSLQIVELELSKTKQQLMASQMHITELKESQIRTISEKDDEIESLQANIKQFKMNVDENAALRAQLELYKNDFELEKAQRNELFLEKNKIADDLQQLQRRNNQLHEEIDQMRSGFVPVKKEETRACPSDVSCIQFS